MHSSHRVRIGMPLPGTAHGCAVSAEGEGGLLPPSMVMEVCRQGSDRQLHFRPEGLQGCDFRVKEEGLAFRGVLAGAPGSDLLEADTPAAAPQSPTVLESGPAAVCTVERPAVSGVRPFATLPTTVQLGFLADGSKMARAAIRTDISARFHTAHYGEKRTAPKMAEPSAKRDSLI